MADTRQPAAAQPVKQRIYKYDNVKAFLIFLVVLGHMNKTLISDSMVVRQTTIWLYSFHMPAFIFLSGLTHKRYISSEQAALGVKGEVKLRWDKVLGYYLCGLCIKVFIFASKTAMGLRPKWHWDQEFEIHWFLFALAAYEIVFFLIGRLEGRLRPWMVVMALFALTAVSGYFPVFDDRFISARFFNFLPLFGLGYYMDMKKALVWFEKKWAGILGWIVIAISVYICATGGFKLYEWRLWFTGRRSYAYLQDYFSWAMNNGWWVRLLVWGVAILMSFAIIAVFPNRDMGPVTKIGNRTMSVYFWHRPVAFLLCTYDILPKIVVALGGCYDYSMKEALPGLAFDGSGWAMYAGYGIYILIAAFITWFFARKPFEHPSKEILGIGAWLGGRNR